MNLASDKSALASRHSKDSTIFKNMKFLFCPSLPVFLLCFAQLDLMSSLPMYSTQIPDYIDTSCHSQRDRCRSLSTTNCTSLSEALVKSYDVNRGSTLSQVAPYPFFSVFDLFFSGLITDSNAPRANSLHDELITSSVLTPSRQRCEYLLHNIRLSQKDTEECKWLYSCKYNPHYFPSFTVEAHRDETSQERNCQGITLPNIKFVKTRCEADPGEEHWCQCDAGHITTGYRHQTSDN